MTKKTLTLLTTTGERPEAFALCVQWMNRQNYDGPVSWIIVDDGRTPADIQPVRQDWEIMLVQPEDKWQPGQNTQGRNLRAGLRAVGLLMKHREMNLVIIEDDDWYAADWLTTVAAELDNAELVGEGWARYYNVKHQRARKMLNDKHASLCSTAMRDGALKHFYEVCLDGVDFIDVDLWKGQGFTRKLFGGHRVVGIKGLPGRAGIGMGHSSKMQGRADPDSEILREWVGQDADAYLRFT